jgi:hypothetical protein
MSFFTDFLIATQREAKKVAATKNPTKTWPGFSSNNLTCLDLATLYGLMTGVTDADSVVEMEDEFEYLNPGDDGSLELRLFPETFTKALASVGSDEAARLAKRWRADEGGVSDWQMTEVRELLNELSELARRAAQARKPIMLCVSGF